MLTGQAKKDYERGYMKTYMKNRSDLLRPASLRPVVLDPNLDDMVRRYVAGSMACEFKPYPKSKQV